MPGTDPRRTAAGESAERIRALRDRAVRAAEDLAIPRRAPGTTIPLSFAQERLWFLDQVVPGDPAYNLGVALRLSGDLDAEALERSLGEIVRRHEILRTRFGLLEGAPIQLVESPGSFHLATLAIRASVASGDREHEVADLAREEAWRPFDLTRGPLFRASLIRIEADEHLLLLTMHHAVSDGWSIGILAAELAELYPAFRAGTPPSLPEPPIQYGDYALWQRARLAGGALEEHRRYWSERLRQAPPVLELPLDHARTGSSSAPVGTVPFVLEARLAHAMRGLAREQGTTLFVALLTAFEVLLHRWTGQGDLCVGVPTAGRSRPELEELVGPFMNTLVMRAQLADDPPVRELLRRTASVALDAYAHEEWPFERLVSELRPDRRAGRSPLVQAVFAFQNLPGKIPQLPGLAVTPFALEGAAAKFDLTMEVQEGEGPLAGALEYRSDLIDASTAARLSDHFGRLVEEIALHPDAHISALSIVRGAERAILLETWNGSPAHPRPSRTLVEVFARQVEEGPDRVAVVCGAERLTYRELNARAEGVAAGLRALGVGPETRVGLCTERSLDLTVGVLGILAAGGAYVPLDPEYPRDRLRFLIADSEAPLVLCDRRSRAGLPAETPAVLIEDLLARRLSDEQAGASSRREDEGAAAEPGDRAAYVIYTSGSTGRPKGVVVTHGNVVRLLEGTAPRFGFGPAEVWTLFHSFAFDFSVWEMWGAWTFGGRLVIVPHDVTRNPQAFYALLREEGVTVLNQTPSAFRQLSRLEEETGERPLALRWVIFGGEKLEPATLRRWFERHGDERPRLVNMYGITETTVHVTWRWLHAADASSGRGSPIGRPLPDVRVYVLDAAGQPSPIGVPGELYVGGAGVARGYWNRPELDAERFVPDPFAGFQGARMYRSGDRARWLEPGELEYLGRLDDQVKVRGFRVECGEIEAALLEHPEIRECAVVARVSSEGETRLAAYVVPRDPRAALETGALRAHLARRVPDHMVPGLYVTMEALPLTAHGKVDRTALPEPGGERPETGVAYEPPRGAVERRLAEVWRTVLGIDRVGREDNFFDLGGDSILSIQIRSRARDAGLEISIPLIFQHQTIRSLALAARSTSGAAGEAPTEAFGLVSAADRERMPPDAEDAYPLSRLQAGLHYHCESSPEYTTYVNSLHVRARYDAAALRAALDELTARHEMLRTSFDFTSFHEPLQIVHRAASIPVTVEDLRELGGPAQDERIRAAIEEEKRRPFFWDRAPLFRFRVHLRGEDAFQLTMCEPFLDGWSVATMLTELFARYRGTGREHDRPLGSRYREYVALERQAIASAESRSYWKRSLAEADGRPLPDRPPAGEVEPHRVCRLDLPIAAGTAEGLQRLARETHVPIKSVLLAAQMKVLAHLTGGSRPVTGLLANGRPEKTDGERIVGPFLNLVPFHVDLGPGTWMDLVCRTFDAERDLLPHRRYPMADLKRETGGRELFDTVFNFTHFHVYRRLRALAGCEVLEAIGNENTYFPLTTQANMDEESGALGLAFDYVSHLVDPGFVREVAGCFTRIFDAMAAAPHDRHETLALLPEAQERALEAWNGRGGAPVARCCIHEWFAEQASRRGEAVALVDGEESLTYRELDTRASVAAAGLRARGVRRETLVGLCLPPSLDLVVAALAILKAGGAYLPLDPDYPAERLEFMIEDSGIPLVVTSEVSRGRIPIAPERIATLEALRQDGRPGPPDPPPQPSRPGDAAYVIYTSGSTGRPKGVVVTHANVVRLFESAQERFGFQEDDVWTLFHSFSFDFSVWETWGALLYGGRLVIVPPRVRRAPDELLRLLERERVTVLNQTPSAFAQLMRADESAGPPDLSLRWIVFGGEALDLAALRPWFDRHGEDRPRLVNMYGITETTVHVTWRPLNRADCRAGIGSAIGRPLDHLRVYVLDANRQRVPVGTPGELWVGGAGVARGYWRRPDLNAERFAPDPFSDVSGARMYRSGDRARWRADGDLEYLGRVDDQLKIRGFRIEPGEVEAALASHLAVREAAVVARGGPSEPRRLVAYVTSRDPENPPEAAALRAHLGARLPDHMVPALYVDVPSLPLTLHGKVDRSALPDPGGVRPALGVAYLPPRGPLEARLAELWREVLGLDRVGRQDDFFDLGGDSIRAMQLIARVRVTFGVEIRVGAVFEARTFEALAARVGVAPPAASPAAAPVAPSTVAATAPLSFAQRRLWFLDRLQPGSAAYNVPAGIRLRGTLEPQTLRATIREIVRRHEPLRTTFAVEDGEPLAVLHAPHGAATQPLEGHAPDAVPDLEIVDLAPMPPEAREREARRWADEEARRPFDLARGPLFRARLLRFDSDDHLLLLNFHHAVADGWSTSIFLRELALLHDAFRQGAPSPLPELPRRFQDHARAQHEALESGRFAEDLAWWRKTLADPPRLDLPTDQLRAQRPAMRGGRVRFELDPGVARDLREASRAYHATLFTTLLAAFQTVLQRWSGQDDLCIGTAVAGRGRVEEESLIGFFANTLVLRADLSGDPTFPELLARVGGALRGAWEHQEVPFEKLVEELRPERDVGRPPLFQVMFVHQSAPVAAFELAGLTAEFLELNPGATKFDLTLSLAESGGEVAGMLEYDGDLFEPDRMSRFAAHYVHLLREIAANPERRIAELPLSDREEVLALSAWSRGSGLPAARSPEPLVHERVVDRARERPDALAVVAAARRLTYGELLRESDLVRHALLSLGLRPGAPVGLCAGRSAEMVVGILGILRAGGAYVPIDPLWPAARASFVIDDSGMRFALVEAALARALPSTTVRPVVIEDCTTRLASGRRSEGPEAGAVTTMSHLAYILYTSGTTGRPKGVEVTHGNLLHSTLARLRSYREPIERFALTPSFAFDSSVAGLFWTLLEGGALVVAEEGDLVDGASTARWFARSRPTHWLGIPSLYRSLLDHANPADLESLRVAIVAGDVCPPELVLRHRAALARTKLFNEYGPTEATVWSTVYDTAEWQPRARVPIGRPIPGSSVFVLDRRLEPSPVGVPGELAVGGPGVTRGYLHQPALTAERFVSTPDAESRLYLTGDLARWLPDGTLELLGRRDGQTKIRGVRIEASEVESVIAEHPAVRACAVRASAAEGGERSLEAFVVASAPVEAEELRRLAASRLPPTMVPRAFHFVGSVPRTTSGKVDRQALAAWRSPVASAEENVAPRDDVERRLQKLWTALLGTTAIGVTRSFFELGGHSLLAVRLASDVEREFGVRLPLTDFFLDDTIAGCARALQKLSGRVPPRPRAERGLVADEQREAALDRSPLAPRVVPLQESGSGPPIWLVHEVEGTLLCYAPLVRRLGTEWRILGLESSAIGEHRPASRSLAQLAEAYAAVVRSRQPGGPYVLAGWSFGGVLGFEIARALAHDGARVAAALLDSTAPELATHSAPLVPGEHTGDDLARVHIEAAARHHPQVLSGRVLLLRATQQERTTRDPSLGWGALAAQGLEVHPIPCDHFGLLRHPAVLEVGEALKEWLRRIAASEGHRAGVGGDEQAGDPKTAPIETAWASSDSGDHGERP